MFSKSLFFALPLFLLSVQGRSDDVPNLNFDPKAHPQIVDAQSRIPRLQVQLKYATKDNFAKQNVYGDYQRCYLVKDAAKKLKAADAALKAQRPDLHLHAYDCLRPRRVQFIFWDIVKGTPSERYVANPHTKTGSIHNYGCAIDLTLARKDGTPIDMGTSYDFFGPAAEPRHEINLHRKGKLSAAQLANRLLLREVMSRAGFYPLNNEWWHFNCATNWQTRKRYKIID